MSEPPHTQPESSPRTFVAYDQTERRPVTEDDAVGSRAAAFDIEPRQPPRGGCRWLPLETQVDTSLVRADAHACQHVDGEAQAIRTPEVLVPAIRLVAVHVFEEMARIVAQREFNLARQFQRRLHRPLRYDAGMHQEVSRLEMGQRPGRQPLEQGVAVGRLQDLIQSIGATRGLAAAGDGQQVQVMVARGPRPRCPRARARNAASRAIAGRDSPDRRRTTARSRSAVNPIRERSARSSSQQPWMSPMA